MGACWSERRSTQRPELFGAVVCSAPLLDKWCANERFPIGEDVEHGSTGDGRRPPVELGVACWGTRPYHPRGRRDAVPGGAVHRLQQRHAGWPRWHGYKDEAPPCSTPRRPGGPVLPARRGPGRPRTARGCRWSAELAGDCLAFVARRDRYARRLGGAIKAGGGRAPPAGGRSQASCLVLEGAQENVSAADRPLADSGRPPAPGSGSLRTGSASPPARPAVRERAGGGLGGCAPGAGAMRCAWFLQNKRLSFARCKRTGGPIRDVLPSVSAPLIVSTTKLFLTQVICSISNLSGRRDPGSLAWRRGGSGLGHGEGSV